MSILLPSVRMPWRVMLSSSCTAWYGVIPFDSTLQSCKSRPQRPTVNGAGANGVRFEATLAPWGVSAAKLTKSRATAH